MNNKRAGTRFERTIVQLFSKNPSVYAVSRVAGSLGPYDIIVCVRGIPLYVQCKKRKLARRSSFSHLFASEIQSAEELRARAMQDGILVPAFAMIYGHSDGYVVLLYSRPHKNDNTYVRDYSTLERVCEFVVRTIEKDYQG